MSKHYLHSLNVFKGGGVAHDIAGEAIDATVGAVASYGFGYLTGKYREKTLIAGRVPLDFGVGVLASFGSVVLEAVDIAPGFTGIAREVGRAGINAWAHTHGVGAGTKSSKLKRALLPEKDVKKFQATFPDGVVLGAISQAAPGQFLSPERLDRLSKP